MLQGAARCEGAEGCDGAEGCTGCTEHNEKNESGGNRARAKDRHASQFYRLPGCAMRDKECACGVSTLFASLLHWRVECASERRREARVAGRERAARWGMQRGPTERSDKWRRGDSHPRPKILPRRNLRCVSVSEISRPASRDGQTVGHQSRMISPPASVTTRQQPACLNDIRSPARRLTGVDAHRCLGCESVLRVRSYGCSIFCRG